eukprot:10373194-Prorocentrum_lima.AAC.1
MTSSLVGSEMCIRDRGQRIPSTPENREKRSSVRSSGSGATTAAGPPEGYVGSGASAARSPRQDEDAEGSEEQETQEGDIRLTAETTVI